MVFAGWLPLDNPDTNQNERTIATANVASHEVGHDLSLPTEDNDNSPADLMTGVFSGEELVQDLDFNEEDAKHLKEKTRE